MLISKSMVLNASVAMIAVTSAMIKSKVPIGIAQAVTKAKINVAPPLMITEDNILVMRFSVAEIGRTLVSQNAFPSLEITVAEILPINTGAEMMPVKIYMR